jgi:hypothetical protein
MLYYYMGGVRPESTLYTKANTRPFVPGPDDDEYATVGGMRICGGNQSTLK